MSLQRARRLFRAFSGGAWQRVTHRHTYIQKTGPRARDLRFFSRLPCLPSLREQTGQSSNRQQIGLSCVPLHRLHGGVALLKAEASHERLSIILGLPWDSYVYVVCYMYVCMYVCMYVRRS